MIRSSYIKKCIKTVEKLIRCVLKPLKKGGKNLILHRK